MAEIQYFPWFVALVRLKGLEPPRPKAPEPKSGVSTNSTTAAFGHFPAGKQARQATEGLSISISCRGGKRDDAFEKLMMLRDEWLKALESDATGKKMVGGRPLHRCNTRSPTGGLLLKYRTTRLYLRYHSVNGRTGHYRRQDDRSQEILQPPASGSHNP